MVSFTSIFVRILETCLPTWLVGLRQKLRLNFFTQDWLRIYHFERVFVQFIFKASSSSFKEQVSDVALSHMNTFTLNQFTSLFRHYPRTHDTSPISPMICARGGLLSEAI